MTVSIMFSRVATTTSARTAGTSDLAVVHGLLGDDHVVARHLDGEVHRRCREALERLVDGHRLRSGHDALAGHELRVLPGHEDFAGQPLLRQRLDRSARGAVVRREHGVERAPMLRDRRVHDLLGVLRLPVVGPVFVDDLDVAAREIRREDLVLSFLDERRVVVRLRAEDPDDLPLARRRQVIDEVLGLELADAHVVEGDVEVEVGVSNEPVVRDDRDTRFVGQPDGLRHRGAVVRDDHEDVHVAREQPLDVGDLPRVVAVRRLHEDLGALRRGAREHHVAIALPARLLQRVHREADEEVRARRGA